MTSRRTRFDWCSRTAASALALVLAAGGVAGSARAEGGYRLGAGDVVQVEVWREPDLSGPHKIDPEGALRHVLVGRVPAAGLTVDELAEALRARLERDYLREARVAVVLEGSARRRAWVLGAVARPGAYPVDESTRLLDLLFAAGGLAEGADGAATLYRMGAPEPGDDASPFGGREPRERVEVSLEALLAGRLADNRAIDAGDVLAVGSADSAPLETGPRGRVRVVGEVANPGTYPLRDAPTALDAVLVAGGFTDYASANKARLVRGEGESRREERLRLEDIARGRAEVRNVELEDGDLIVVPESFF